MVELSPELRNQMVAEAISAFPNEGCGLLLGQESQSGHVGSIEQFVPIGNAAASPVEYRLDSGQYAEAAAKATVDGLDVVGIMHSHPTTPAVLSAVDIRRAEHRLIPANWHWVVVSLLPPEPDVQSYVIANGVAIPELFEHPG